VADVNIQYLSSSIASHPLATFFWLFALTHPLLSLGHFSLLPPQSPVYKPLSTHDQNRTRHVVCELTLYVIYTHYTKADLAYIQTLAVAMGGLYVLPVFPFRSNIR
jgi:hypothetical protein